MRCEYCEVEVTQYPENGICVCCGGRLPPKPAVPVTVTHNPPYRAIPLTPGFNCCPKCHSNQIIWQKRGFSWGIGILGFLLIPVFGLFLGFIGCNSPRRKCVHCRHKWK